MFSCQDWTVDSQTFTRSHLCKFVRGTICILIIHQGLNVFCRQYIAEYSTPVFTVCRRKPNTCPHGKLVRTAIQYHSKLGVVVVVAAQTASGRHPTHFPNLESVQSFRRKTNNVYRRQQVLQRTPTQQVRDQLLVVPTRY